jgi:hypothetical protein
LKAFPPLKDYKDKEKDTGECFHYFYARNIELLNFWKRENLQIIVGIFMEKIIENNPINTQKYPFQPQLKSDPDFFIVKSFHF